MHARARLFRCENGPNGTRGDKQDGPEQGTGINPDFPAATEFDRRCEFPNAYRWAYFLKVRRFWRNCKAQGHAVDVDSRGSYQNGRV